jgi:hypothetical protein
MPTLQSALATVPAQLFGTITATTAATAVKVLEKRSGINGKVRTVMHFSNTSLASTNNILMVCWGQPTITGQGVPCGPGSFVDDSMIPGTANQGNDYFPIPHEVYVYLLSGSGSATYTILERVE